MSLDCAHIILTLDYEVAKTICTQMKMPSARIHMNSKTTKCSICIGHDNNIVTKYFGPETSAHSFQGYFGDSFYQMTAKRNHAQHEGNFG